MDIRDDGGLAILYRWRLSELERRVAELEEEVRLTRDEGRTDDHAPPGEQPASADADSSPAGPSDLQLEGARLVVIEMLTSGYERAQIVTYLSETFGIDHGEALIEEAGAVRS